MSNDGKNYLSPYIKFEDSPEDRLSAMLIFAKALGFTLVPNTGVTVTLENDMKDSNPFLKDIDKVIVYLADGMIKVVPVEDDELTDGAFVKVEDEIKID